MNLLTTLAGCGVDAAPLDSGPRRYPPAAAGKASGRRARPHPSTAARTSAIRTVPSAPERGDLGTVQRLQLVEQAGRCGRDPVTLATSTSNTRSCDCPDAFTTPLSVAMIDPSDMP